MKDWKKCTIFVLMLVVCLILVACGDGGSSNDDSEEYRAPGVIEGAAYDSAADASGYEEYFGIWEGVGDAEGDTLEITPADGGMYFTLYSGEELIASGNAQDVPEYAYIYFFNQHDGNAYQFAVNYDGDMELYSFGAFVMKTPAPSTLGGFEDIADIWYLDGDPEAASSIEIDANGEWTLYERLEGDGDSTMTDYGYLEQDPAIEDQYYAHSRQFEDVTYDMYTSFEKEAFSWGDESDSYLRLTDSTDENPAEQLGYDSIEDMRTQEHEIIDSDDNDNMVAEGYWYPDGDRNSLTYIKVQRDTLYWYEFDPEQGDVQVGEADGVVFSIGSKRRLKSGTTFTYTSAWNFEDCKICFEGDTTEYYWRER